MKVKIVRIDKTLPLPQYHTEGSAAFDVCSRINAEIRPGETQLLPSNLIVEVPKGHVLMITARSSLFKKGLILANGVGIIDQDYNGPADEIKTAVYNFSDKPVEIKKSERIAQGLILPIERAEWVEVDIIKNESRGGFGSTGG